MRRIYSITIHRSKMASEDDDIPESGAVFTFGKSRFADNTANKFWIRNDQAVVVSCGDDHSALVTENGRLYVFGANDWGQLGLGHTKSVNKPSSVKGLKAAGVVQVACGRVHTLALTRNRRLHSFGAGGEGQLGVGNSKQHDTPTLIEALAEQDYSMIACGTDHSAALTVSGALYTWGGGAEGQLGHGEETEISLPRELSIGVPVKMVSCGYYHTAFVTEDKRLFTFGEGEGGKLGLGEEGEGGSNEPRHVTFFLDPVDSVSCGNAHTAAITEKGELYTFGDGASGQLGHGPDFLQTSSPKRVAKLEWTECRAVHCGESHTAVITVKGSLYTFGDGRHGKLAQGEESFSNVFLPSKVYRFKGFLVEQVSCGGCHTLVRARRRQPPDDPASDSEPEESEPRFKDPVLGNNLAKLAQSIDLQGSLNGSIGGTARTRRRQREGSPLPPLSRTLPPLGSSTPKASGLPGRNVPLSLRPLNGSRPPPPKLPPDGDEIDGPRRGSGGGGGGDGNGAKKASDEDSAMEDDEGSSESETERPDSNQDPFGTTHFSKSGTRQALKPLTVARHKKPHPKEAEENTQALEVAPLDRRKKPESGKEEDNDEDNDDEDDDDSEEEEEETKPKKGKMSLSMMAGPKASSSKPAPKPVKKEESEEEDDDDDDDSEEEMEEKKDSKTKEVKPAAKDTKAASSKPGGKKPSADEKDNDDDDDKESDVEKTEAVAKTKDVPKKDSKAKPGTSTQSTDDDDDDDDDSEDEGEDTKKDKDVPKTTSTTKPEEAEPKSWQFWKKKKTDSPNTSTVSPSASTTSTSSAKKPGNQGGSKTCTIL